MTHITEDQVRRWLGFSSDEFKLSEAIEVITDIANKKYSEAMLRKDLIAYVKAKKDSPYK